VRNYARQVFRIHAHQKVVSVGWRTGSLHVLSSGGGQEQSGLPAGRAKRKQPMLDNKLKRCLLYGRVTTPSLSAPSDKQQRLALAKTSQRSCSQYWGRRRGSPSSHPLNLEYGLFARAGRDGGRLSSAGSRLVIDDLPRYAFLQPPVSEMTHHAG
jgi:hypothetical protein